MTTIAPNSITHWLIRADQPFRCAQSFLLPDGTVAYTNGMTPEAYAADRGFPVRVITDAELDEMEEARLASLVTEPTEETEEQFNYALEVLPPSKFGTVRGVLMFHICERITGDLVSWHGKINGRCFTCNDRSHIDREALAAKFARAAA